jgi:hypothetical protein
MNADYSERARQTAKDLALAAGELLEHVLDGSNFTDTASRMRRVGELLMRLDGQLQGSAVPAKARAEHA